MRRKPAAPDPILEIDFNALTWALGMACALQRKPFDAELLRREFPPPATNETVVRAARAAGFSVTQQSRPADQLKQITAPCLVVLTQDRLPGHQPAQQAADAALPATLALLAACTDDTVELFPANEKHLLAMPRHAFNDRYLGLFFVLEKMAEPVHDPDPQPGTGRFGFSWFLPTLRQHRKVWRDVLLASLVIQLLALGMPLFTQAIIDKVVVHRTESTLAVVAAGMVIFTLFSALLGWMRQYLVLHTGNRVDAVLGAAVFDHLFRLPLRWFESRPTGVIAARLQGVEAIREFIATAAVTLILDLPFLLIFIAVMFLYSVPLTVVTLVAITMIITTSALVAPLFQARLNRQFLLGARNQAFLTEYVAGIETVKSLQMEPQLRARYGDYLADYMHASFSTRQLANTYNAVAGVLEQTMGLLILLLGAWMVMRTPEFTIGMLIAFQMFAARVSQPMMRLVGLWQQFQQAVLALRRLGDVMEQQPEPHCALPVRSLAGSGQLTIDGLAFRHSERHSWLYRDFSLRLQPGSVLAIMGPSGSGKSTLAKLLQGLYLPSDGRILIDGISIANLSVNQLRQYFGVVPQETVLFAGTVLDNLQATEPHALFEQIVATCRLAGIHDTIQSLPNGYQTPIGERGVGLSGGQRQRLAIARALLKRPRILIFDEATSALDATTAAHFAETINQLRGHVSMLFITHALPPNLVVDEIVRLETDQSQHQNQDQNRKQVDPHHTSQQAPGNDETIR